MTVVGADSAVPQPHLYEGRQFWAYYVADHRTTPYVWAQNDVKALATYNVFRGLPICVAPETWPWSLGLQGELALLLGEAVLWGVPKDVPLVLDLEEPLVAAGADFQTIGNTWLTLCNSQGFKPWVYGGNYIAGLPCDRWLAQWPLPAGEGPAQAPDTVPSGYSAWQYAGNVESGAIDLDIMTDDAFKQLMLTATLSAPDPPKPPPDPPEEDDMGLIVKGSKGGEWLITGGFRVPIHNQKERACFLASGAKDAPVDAGWTDAIIAKFPINTDAVKHIL